MPIKLTIPKPCHEDWNHMTPGTRPEAGRGERFCGSCQHHVADLTRATDAELLALFTSDARPRCARFDPQQLDRLLGEAGPARSPVPVAAFTSLLAVAAGQDAMAQAELHVKGEPAVERTAPLITVRMGLARIDAPPPVDAITLGEVMPLPHATPLPSEPVGAITGDTIVVPQEVVTGQPTTRTDRYGDDHEPNSSEGAPVITGGAPCTYGDVRGGGPAHIAAEGTAIRGHVVDAATGEDLPFAAVRLAGTMHGTASDDQGNFTIAVPAELCNGPLAIKIHAAGYTALRVADISHHAPRHAACLDTADVAHAPLSGRVVDGSTGNVLRGASVEWLERGLRCCTDTHGSFGFPVEQGWSGTITLRISAPGSKQQERMVPNDQLPCCVPIALERSSDPGPVVERAPIDLGDLMLHQRETMLLGMVVARRPSLWQRMTRPFRRW